MKYGHDDQRPNTASMAVNTNVGMMLRVAQLQHPPRPDAELKQVCTEVLRPHCDRGSGSTWIDDSASLQKSHHHAADGSDFRRALGHQSYGGLKPLKILAPDLHAHFDKSNESFLGTSENPFFKRLRVGTNIVCQGIAQLAGFGRRVFLCAGVVFFAGLSR